jgi:diaminopimelate epimerase
MKETVKFTKMHGAGNDYIYVNTLKYHIADPEKAAIAWSDRHKGIGSDGLVLIGASPVPEADFSMRIFNADGSEAMMCGNASRCIGKYLYERALTTQTQIRLLTLSGIKTLELHVNGSEVESVTVDMLSPVLEDSAQFVPTRGLDKGTFVSMGNPHYVIFTDDIDQVGETGRMLELHPAFPQRCNIEFARIVPSSEDDGSVTTIRTRVWERGSGITQACGTGACATAVAACITGRAGRHSSIIMDGGTLDIEWRQADNHVYMTGPAAFVFDGEIEMTGEW